MPLREYLGKSARRALERGHAIRNHEGRVVERPHVVADSSIFIADFLQIDGGFCTTLLDLVGSTQRLYYSDCILTEVDNVLQRYQVKPDVTEKYIKSIIDMGTRVTPVTLPLTVCKDVSDLYILGSAVAANCEVLYTRDHHLTSINKYKGIQIVHPADMGLSTEEFIKDNPDLRKRISERRAFLRSLKLKVTPELLAQSTSPHAFCPPPFH